MLKIVQWLMSWIKSLFTMFSTLAKNKVTNLWTHIVYNYISLTYFGIQKLIISFICWSTLLALSDLAWFNPNHCFLIRCSLLSRRLTGPLTHFLWETYSHSFIPANLDLKCEHFWPNLNFSYFHALLALFTIQIWR